MNTRLVVCRRFVAAALVLLLSACDAGASASDSLNGTPLPSGWASPQPASAEIISVLEGRIEAYNRSDFDAAAAFWAEDGMLAEWEGDPCGVATGREAIAARLADVQEIIKRMQPAGTPIQFGRLVAQPVHLLNENDASAPSWLIFEMNEDGLIWIEYVTFYVP